MADDVRGEGFGCRECWPPGADAAWAARSSLGRAAELIDESHLGVSLLACAGCGQQFVSVFVEEVDWVDADDPQYWTLMPITQEEAAEILRLPHALIGATLEGLGAARRSLRVAHPKGEPRRIFWGTGVSIR